MVRPSTVVTGATRKVSCGIAAASVSAPAAFQGYRKPSWTTSPPGVSRWTRSTSACVGTTRLIVCPERDTAEPASGMEAVDPSVHRYGHARPEYVYTTDAAWNLEEILLDARCDFSANRRLCLHDPSDLRHVRVRQSLFQFARYECRHGLFEQDARPFRSDICICRKIIRHHTAHRKKLARAGSIRTRTRPQTRSECRRDRK